MKDRIRKIRKDTGLNQTEFGEAIGATQRMLTTYETGAVVPDKTMRLLICEKFHVNLTWLETGEGEQYKQGINYAVLRLFDDMPALRDMLEAALPVMTRDDIRNLNTALAKFIDSLRSGDNHQG